ncbi:response regulator transcription factor [Oxalobacteraceae bacterium R-40]|uniref:Response regulator transcription factor n=1 Tax=Keguizhuia sedimenti TaxID=3064264 RepID=A0ABU1BKS0_9BURK|nr:response regulator transcription factor [Oxalobacteraceae bacterium R-40]
MNSQAANKADNKLRLLLVDDHDVVRSGVRAMLSGANDIMVAHEAGSVQEAIRLVQGHAFDVALVDISLPGKNGLELVKFLRMQKPQIAILVFSIYSEKIYALRALKLSVSGYLTKNGTGHYPDCRDSQSGERRQVHYAGDR